MPSGMPHPRHNDVCKQDLIAVDINLYTWKATAKHWIQWRQAVTSILLNWKENSDHILKYRGHIGTNGEPQICLRIYMCQVWQEL